MTTNSYIDDEPVLSDLIGKIIRCATEVHKFLGNSFGKVVYQDALSIEFELRNVSFERDFELPLYYKGEQIGTRRADFFVDEKVMVEIKVVAQLEEIHLNQAINFLEAYNKEVALLLNFGSKSLDFKRVTNNKYQSQS